MAALGEKDPGIPYAWLKTVRNKAASYAKNQTLFIKDNSSGDAALSTRERELMSDLYNGLTQSEIAEKRNLSVNTVRMVIKNIYEKLNVHKISDLVRIAAEQKLV